ncbi:MAG: hypothetical protein HZB55_00670 [Deltaproteobacteria bacterium]|nr:hypothetical protein [Deltaproteobacteria bacterium]
MTAPIEIHDISLRESIGDFVTFNVRAEELTEGLRLLDQVGYTSIDVFGGTTFLPTMKVLGEDPWERLRTVRRAITRTPIQAALRGRLVFGSKPAPTTTIRAVLRHLRGLGVDRIKVVDLGLDLQGARDVVAMAKDLGFYTIASIVLCYGAIEEGEQILPVASAGYASAGADGIVIQDPFGLLGPTRVSELVHCYARHCALPLRLHLHDVNLVGLASLQAGLQAGVQAVDTIVSALSWGYSPPQAESVLSAVKGMPGAPGLELPLLEEVSAWFEQLKTRKGFHYKGVHAVDHSSLQGRMPLAIRRALDDELRERGRADLSGTAWDEVTRVWEALGRPPTLIPLVRALCSQAIENVLDGNSFAHLDERVAAYLRGDFGPPRPGARPELIERARAETPSGPTHLLDVDDLLPESFPSEDDRLTRALFPTIAADFFDVRASGFAQGGLLEMYPLGAHDGLEPAPPMVPRALQIRRQGEVFDVTLEGLGPEESGRRSLFLKIGGQTEKVDVTFPSPDAPPIYAVNHHGHRHQVEFVEVLPPGKKSVPVLLREDGTLNEVLFSIPRSV